MPLLRRRVIVLLALTCGVAVGNIYFPQTISPLVAEGLGVAPDTAALVVTAAQLGYAVGIFLLAPLGDRLPHRPLVVALLVATALCLAGAAAAPSLPPLVGMSALVGVTTVIAPIVVPMAAGLVPDERRGAVTGTLLAGAIGGMLLSRAVSGAAGEWLGWRAPYLLAAGLALGLALLLARWLPPTTPSTRERYRTLLWSTVVLLRTEPDLRRSAFYQATVFAAFTAVWTAVALLMTGPVYGLGASAVGLLALVNAATMVAAPVAGRQSDRRGPDPVNLLCLLAVPVAAAVLAIGSYGGVAGLAALVVGTLLLDVAMQSGMVANQVRIFALRPRLRGRLNTAYLMCAFLGGGAGSWLGTRAYTGFGWPGVCVLVALLGCLALARHLTRPTARHRAAPAVALSGDDGQVRGGA